MGIYSLPSPKFISMKIITNTTLVERRSKWAKRIAPLTMLFLLGGLITNFLSINQPQLLQPTLILLALGFVSAIFSSHLVNTWVREPRADQVLAQLLKKFGNDYVLFNYTSPVPHTLIAPDGLYVFVVKNHDGQITVNGRRFSRKFTWRRVFRLLADEGLGAPITEAENRIKKLNNFLGKNLAAEDIPELKSLILFSNKSLQLSVTNPAIPVVSTKEFKLHLREQGKRRVISAAQRKKLVNILDMQS
jgi:hypothetical protein